jgi:queuine tRNA-ribosyltransferase
MQQDDMRLTFVPSLSTNAGQCLTLADWDNAQATILSYQLDKLLMKPGIEILQQISTLRHYFPWSNHWVLNACFLNCDTIGNYYCRSIYDGTLIKLSVKLLVDIIINPDHVLLPVGSSRYFQEFWQQLPGDIHFYFSLADDFSTINDSKKSIIKYYLTTDMWPSIVQIVKSYPQVVFILSEINLITLHKIFTSLRSDVQPIFIESNKPADDGMKGIIYKGHALVNLLDKALSNCHQILDNTCQCQTCCQQLTYAYLHHLLQHTPLLAQRFLIQHNIYQCCKLTRFS